jgi:hypothetical protein
MKLLRIITMDLKGVDQLLIRYFAFFIYWEKMGAQRDTVSPIYRLQESL